MQDTSINKPGIKTTEFWATILGTIIVAGSSEFRLNISYLLLPLVWLL